MSAKVIAAILARDAAQFLVFKRAMGVGYQSGEFTLKRFLDFVSKQYGEGPVPLNEAVTRWATRIDGRKPVTVANEFGVVRQLCLFRRRSDPPTASSPSMPWHRSRTLCSCPTSSATKRCWPWWTPPRGTRAAECGARYCVVSRSCCIEPACGWVKPSGCR